MNTKMEPIATFPPASNELLRALSVLSREGVVVQEYENLTINADCQANSTISIFANSNDAKKAIALIKPFLSEIAKDAVLKKCPKCEGIEWIEAYKRFGFLVINEEHPSRIKCKKCGFSIDKSKKSLSSK